MNYDRVPNLVKLFDARQDLREKVLLSYGIDFSLVKLSNSEFMKKINDVDTGKLYNSAVSLMIITLMGSGEGIQDIIRMKTQYDTNKLAIKDSAKATNNPCAKYKIIAKHYIELDELEDDNNTNVYFDKKYDTTYYDIIKEYKFDTTMPLEERISILTNKLMEKNGLTENDARRDAQAMVDGKRLVEDGDYAIFEFTGMGEVNFNYYIRVNNKWIEDDSIPRDLMADTAKMFCNLNEKCIQVKGDCLTADAVGETALKNSTLKSMIDEQDNYFNDKLETNFKNIQDKIKEEFDDAEFRIGRIATSNVIQLFKYEEQKFRIGATVEENITVVSPYLNLRDKILGQGDFVKKQLDIIKFKTHFTRDANVESSANISVSSVEESGQVESPFWYYCIKTNTKLLPTFFVEIANAFITDEVLEVVDKICAIQGTISEDGNTWVDKYSGYIIRNIDLSTEEEFTEDGFKAKTRSVMEADLGESILQLNKTKRQFDNPESEKVSNIISTMAREMGINIDSQKEFIIKNVINQQGLIMMSREKYNKTIAAAAAKGRKMDDYDTAYNSLLLNLSLCYFLIGIQLSVPMIKTRKTFPGCIRSFTGFPLGKPEDKSAITYIACVAHKIRSATDTWKSIMKMKASDIANSIETIITKYILQSDEIKEKFEYFRANPVETRVEEEYSIGRWINFLPPLHSVTVSATSLRDVTEEFKKELMTALRKGSPSQNEMLNIIRSKMITFSMGIIESIQKTVTKKSAIMTNNNGEPFLENACCYEGETNTLKYFSNSQPDIITFNNNVVKLGDVLNDISYMEKAGMFYDPVDTKFKFPIISDEFSEDVIYKAFIVFCKYGSAIPISESLRSICIEKPENFNENEPLNENIRKLKRDGRNYSKESLEQLLQIVNSNNLVKINLQKTAVTNIQVLRDILTSTDQRDVSSPPKIFRDHFMRLLDNFEIGTLFEDTVEMRSFKNYLDKANQIMLESIKTFIKKPAGTKAKDIKQFNECIESIAVFEETGDGLFIDRADETIYKMINYIKNSLRSLTREFPNIILNKVDYADVNIPAHWNLSRLHNSDIKTNIKKHYAALNEYYDDPEVAMIMQKIKKITRDTELLAKYTLFFAPIQTDADKYMYSVFDRRLTIMLFKFYFYSVITDIISLKDNDDILVQKKVQLSRERERERGEEDEDKEEDELYSEDIINAKLNGDVDPLEVAIVQGNQLELAVKISNIIITFTTILCNDKYVIDYNYKSLMERILRAKEKEKDGITTDLNKMTIEEREVEKTFKKHKLERWSKGLQKGFVSYEKGTYDEEREIMEKQAITEQALGKKSVVTDMNRDIYMLDADQENADDADIDRENDMITDLGEDAEYEDYDMDGDEQY